MVDIFNTHESKYVKDVNKPCDAVGCYSTPMEKLIIENRESGSKTFTVCKPCFDKISRIQKAFQEFKDN